MTAERAASVTAEQPRDSEIRNELYPYRIQETGEQAADGSSVAARARERGSSCSGKKKESSRAEVVNLSIIFFWWNLLLWCNGSGRGSA